MNKTRVVGVLAALFLVFGAVRPALAQGDIRAATGVAAAAVMTQADARPLHDYVAKMSLQEQPGTEPKAGGGKMPMGYKVGSAVLFGIGGYYFLSYAVTDPEGEVCILGTCTSNSTRRKAWIGIGTGACAIGAIVLAKGFSKAHEMAPSLSFGRGRVTVTETIPLRRRH